VHYSHNAVTFIHLYHSIECLRELVVALSHRVTSHIDAILGCIARRAALGNAFLRTRADKALKRMVRRFVFSAVYLCFLSFAR
jgi:hypothetical protein